MLKPLPADDLRRVVEQVGDAWELLRTKTVWITGARGFVGRWMSESIREMVRAKFQSGKASGDEFEVWHNVEDVEHWWPHQRPDYVIHATTDGIGWQHVAAVCRAAGARMLLLSSGAVYGTRQEPVKEEHYGRCFGISEYGQDKHKQELGCADIAVIARLFTFIGPGLRRHTGREFLEADPITVNDDGAVRSYLYAADLAAHLWTILLRGQVGRAYNVGSSEAITVKDFAVTCARVRNENLPKSDSRQVPCTYLPGMKRTDGTYYVPDTTRAEQELGLRQTVGLDEAIRRTLAWQSK